MATSLIYSFFLVFLAIIAALLSSYIANKTILNRYNEEVIENLNQNPFIVAFLTYNAEIHSSGGNPCELINSEVSFLQETVKRNKSISVQYLYDDYTVTPSLLCESQNGRWSFDENHEFAIEKNKASLKLLNINDNITCTMRWLG